MKTKPTPVAAGISIQCSLALCFLATLNLSADTLLTFQVDLTVQVSIGRWSYQTNVYAPVSVTGSFRNLGELYALTNDPAGANPWLFSGTFMDTNDAPGSTLSYRFTLSPGSIWEFPVSTGGSNRTTTLPASEGAHLVIPLVYFDDLLPNVPVVTNDVTFQVDMSAQRPFRPQCNPAPVLTVSCTGPNSWWMDYLSLTNNPSADNTNLYSGVRTVVGEPGAACRQYLFSYSWSCSGYGVVNGHEQRSTAGGAYRSYNLLATNGPLTLPAVLFDDLNPSDMLPAAARVQFSVDMTGAVGSDGHAFDPTVDKVYVNGDFLLWRERGSSGGSNLSWASWGRWAYPGTNGDSLTEPVVDAYQLRKIAGSQVYSACIILDQPHAVALTYRYTINGADNEPTGGMNHLRYVRKTGEYALPLDTFGVPHQEPSFGDLSVARSDANHLRISWLGRPGVRLQSCAAPAASPWQDHPGTDGLNSTNWPTAGGQRFFRLVKP